MIRTLAALLLAGIALTAHAGHAYTEFGTSAGAENLTGDAAAWHYQEVNWTHRDSNAMTYYAALGRAQRFELNDTYLRGGLHLPVSQRWAFNAEVTASPENHFLPRDAVFAGIDYTVYRGLLLHAGFRQSRYQDSQANVATLGLESYIGAWRFAYTLFEGTSGGASGAANLVQADYYYGDRSHVGLALVHGREVERINPTRLVVTPVNGLSLAGAQALSTHWAVTYTLGVTSLQDFYTRRGVSIGVVYRF